MNATTRFCQPNQAPGALYFFFFNDTATTEIYTLSLHDALPICQSRLGQAAPALWAEHAEAMRVVEQQQCVVLIDRKSTRLNSSHLVISYAVFCLKKKRITRFALRCRRTNPRSTLSASGFA